MIHLMKLQPSPFEKIKDGTKTIEMRLFDDKRRKIQIGDTIILITINSALSQEYFSSMGDFKR